MFRLAAHVYSQNWWDLERLKEIMASNSKQMMLVVRDVDLGTAHDILHSAVAANTTEYDTISLISNLVLAESKLVRTSTIILASFNTLAAFITAFSILYDCYWASKRCNPNHKASKFCLKSIHPAETFPLVLAIAIVIQGLIFSGVQGRGLDSLFTDGCAKVAQLVLPAIFIVPYIQLIFGLECALRSLRSLPFQSRGKYDVTICLCIVALMLIATWIPSHIHQQSDVCFASLLWYLSGYGMLVFQLLSSTAGLMLICAFVIFCRLSTVNLIDQHQRIVASRIVHHMIVGVVCLVFVLPFFISVAQHGGSTKLSMMATIMLNISGLLSGLLHLVLRSNTSTTSFGPKVGESWDRRKHEIRIFGPNELALYNPLFDPIPGPATLSPEHLRYSNRSFNQGYERDSKVDLEKLLGNASMETDNLINGTQKIQERQNSSPVSYNLFPHQDLYHQKGQTPTLVYNVEELDLPRPIFARNSRHMRNSSDSSVTTVQIGLRLSQVPTENLIDNESFRLPATTYSARLGDSLSPQSPVSPQNLKPSIHSDFQRAVLPPTQLKLDNTDIPSSSLGTPLRSSALSTNYLRDNSNILSKIEGPESVLKKNRSSSLKVLSFIEQFRTPSIRLSPDVYKPEKKVSNTRKGSLDQAKSFSSEPSTQSDNKNPQGKSEWI